MTAFENKQNSAFIDEGASFGESLTTEEVMPGQCLKAGQIHTRMESILSNLLGERIEHSRKKGHKHSYLHSIRGGGERERNLQKENFQEEEKDYPGSTMRVSYRTQKAMDKNKINDERRTVLEKLSGGKLRWEKKGKDSLLQEVPTKKTRHRHESDLQIKFQKEGGRAGESSAKERSHVTEAKKCKAVK